MLNALARMYERAQGALPWTVIAGHFAKHGISSVNPTLNRIEGIDGDGSAYAVTEDQLAQQLGRNERVGLTWWLTPAVQFPCVYTFSRGHRIHAYVLDSVIDEADRSRLQRALVELFGLAVGSGSGRGLMIDWSDRAGNQDWDAIFIDKAPMGVVPDVLGIEPDLLTTAASWPVGEVNALLVTRV